MATSVSTLVAGIRRFVRDVPDQDVITASLSSGATSVSVADSTLYYKNMLIEVDSETMIVRSITNSTTVAVARGTMGSTAATHASGADVLVKPAWPTAQILDALNDAIQASYPWVYQEVMDTTITIATGVYEYAVPNMPGTYGGDSIPMPRIYAIDILDPGGSTVLPWIPLSGWNIRRDITAPKIKISYLENPGATLRVRGYGPFPDVALTDSLHPAFPRNLTQALKEYAGAVLLASGEAGRLRTDTGLLDTREAAQRPGTSMQASTAMEGRFQRRLANCGVPPMTSRAVVTR